MAEKEFAEIARELKPVYQKGMDALQRDNFDYAIALFTQILEKEPSFFDCREALRRAQIAKAGGRGGFFKKAFNLASSQPQAAKARYALNSNPLEALQIAEQILNGDPYNSGAHRIVADAALAAGLPRTAVLSLEALHKNSPDDTDLAVQFARALAESGQSTRAEKILHALCRANPNNAELSMQLKDISALKTLGEGGYDQIADGQGSYRDILRNEAQAVSLEQENRVQKTDDVTARLIGEYETRLQTEPKNIKLIRNLAELYTQKKQYDRALEYYEKIRASEGGNDSTLDRSIADLTVRRYDAQVAELNPFAPDYAEQAAKINAEKLNFQITECQSRAERYPTDLTIRYEMGLLNFQAGRFSEAIADFQKATSNPHKRISAMSHLAQCFAKRKMFDLAARTLQNAIKEKPGHDEEKKDLIYQLGCVLEAMGKKEEAIDQFKLIYETDISYRDVAAKVDAFYAGS